jgi:hypothetical protein
MKCWIPFLYILVYKVSRACAHVIADAVGRCRKFTLDLDTKHLPTIK